MKKKEKKTDRKIKKEKVVSIFLSYAREDESLATALQEELQRVLPLRPGLHGQDVDQDRG